MSLLLAATLAAAIQPTCSWDHPGRNPYTGSAAAAIDRYTDIPESVRGTLKRRLEDHAPDDSVSITRDHISGKNQYDPTIRDMHFGASSVCGSVTRSQWAETRAEPAAVYCVGEHCILVPKICGNVSRITRLTPAMAQAGREPVSAAQANESDKPQEFADIRLVGGEVFDISPALFDATTDPSLEFDLDSLLQNPRQRLADRLAAALFADAMDSLALEGDDSTSADEQARKLARRLGAMGGDGIDGVAAPVPEADTWAMLLGGLGLVGWAARRRAKAAAGAAR
ncbi:PEP-CTERM sorting domain-containing protein [Pseudoduganella sp. FT26W]|uniref:PEP-CTERM sorting domain-containing protein n=1 Tax=Duganella aquatilis TaxID=2666082 RepID=A0A844CUX2_9BURK|nr:MHFG family PEP-CTERM protein [Duganella aquatilis]MRW82571.1 PEP-CTERM sorting domain-containing protein [Duganella aquatilis]